jgi:hypothetical protein
VLRSLKELEFDKAMGKVSEADFADISQRLRARAITLMQDLDRVVDEPSPVRKVPRGSACPKCDTRNDPDARFCKSCGSNLQPAAVGARS